MAVFIATLTARKPHTCSNCCEEIKPGERYERHSMTPDDEYGCGRWWTLTIHASADCPLTRGAS